MLFPKVRLDSILVGVNILTIYSLPLQRDAMSKKTRPVRLWQEISLTLMLKVIVLFVIWAVWFSAPEQDSLDDQTVATQILSQQIHKEPNHDAYPGTR
jgi:hypothetical protein